VERYIGDPSFLTVSVKGISLTGNRIPGIRSLAFDPESSLEGLRCLALVTHEVDVTAFKLAMDESIWSVSVRITIGAHSQSVKYVLQSDAVGPYPSFAICA
jgi:hypothetical protein